MRSRPEVRVNYSPRDVVPGVPIDVGVLLRSKSDTPIDFVDCSLLVGERTYIGKAQHYATLFGRSKRHKATTLGVEERRLMYRFDDIPPLLPPAYVGVLASVWWNLDVHVAIPWWPDRRARFALPLRLASRDVRDSPPSVFATSPTPLVGQLYAEASVNNKEYAPGDVIDGVVSFSNVSARPIRFVEVELRSIERLQLPMRADHISGSWKLPIVNGPPPEGVTVPFRLRIPPNVMPSFQTRAFELRWELVIHADQGFFHDTYLQMPITLVPATPSRTPRGRVWPVGEDRVAHVWSAAATKLGIEYDPVRRVVLASRPPVTLEISRGIDSGALAAVATYEWPALGVDLELGERSFLHTFEKHAWLFSNPPDAARRFAAHGRERSQVASFLTEELLQHLLYFQTVRVSDHGARLTSPGNVTSPSAFERFAHEATWVAVLFARAHAAVPAPLALLGAVDAWREFALSVGGTLHLGSMSVQNASIGTASFEILTTFNTDGAADGVAIRFPLSPPLANDPDPQDPGISPAARDLLTRLRKEEPSLYTRSTVIGWVESNFPSDPQSLVPKITEVGKLVSALRGLSSAGPFR